MSRLSPAGLFFVVVALAAIALPGRAIAAGDSYPTNLELVESATRAALDSLRVSEAPGPENDVEILIEGRHAGAWLVRKILNERLLRRGWDIKVRTEGPDSAAVGDTQYEFRLKIVQLDMVYGKQWRRYLIGSRMVERTARVSLFVELINTIDDEIIESMSGRAEVHDTVPASALPALDDPAYGFASPELEKGNMDKYLEGGLVLAIIGVLVYLFYSNKTAS